MLFIRSFEEAREPTRKTSMSQFVALSLTCFRSLSHCCSLPFLLSLPFVPASSFIASLSFSFSPWFSFFSRSQKSCLYLFLWVLYFGILASSFSYSFHSATCLVSLFSLSVLLPLCNFVPSFLPPSFPAPSFLSFASLSLFLLSYL